MDTTKTAEPRRIVSVWCEPALVERLDEAASAADRSRSAELRVALRRHLHAEEEEER